MPNDPRVSAGRREAARTAAAGLGYRPNAHAAQLAGRRTMTVGGWPVVTVSRGGLLAGARLGAGRAGDGGTPARPGSNDPHNGGRGPCGAACTAHR
ncbi:hypothetical protein GCM10010255_62820 [Streptomyces coeruleofuscus]|uniref:LacI family transcriptional regulator n=1 Tax=Streptomyces coeruleofuscus TaxID=66879 RepID=A0ABN3IX67_9ACTN